jgi:serine protease Do
VNRKCCGFTARTWLAGVGLVVVLSAIAVAVGATSHHTTKGTAGTETAWYSEAAPLSSARAMASHASAAAQKAEPARDYAKSLSNAFHNAASRVLPAVVMITNTPTMAERSSDRKSAPDQNSEDMPFGFRGMPFGDLFRNPQFRQFFKESPSGPMPEMPGHGMVGAGSGVIVDPSGVILTNNHVVAGGGKVMVRLHDGREFKAVDIKTDPKTDLAILRIEGAGPLPAAQLGNSDQVEVGDWVLALGEPFGLEGTVTAGIVSAKGRGLGITDREDFIQTDAAINPGNSGGPLVNLDGQVIAINTAISTRSGSYQGVGFAIPANLAKWVGGQLETAGKVQRAYLGVVIQPVTQPLAEQFKVKVHEGVLVTEVQSNTPAAKAGLKPGDIILDFAGKAVSNPRRLQGLVEVAKVGSSQPLAILRDGKGMTLNVTCREQPTDFGMVRTGSRNPGNTESSSFEKLGIQVENLTPQVAEQLGVKIDHGVAITDVRSGSPADLAGLSNGMVITEANRHPVKTIEDFRKALGNKPMEKGVLLLVRSAEGSRFVVIQVESK